jgi:anti-sigma factor RsiW
MNCQSARPMLEALLDNELDANQRTRMLAHLEECPPCEDQYRNLQSQQADIRAHATYFRAPDSLRQAVAGNLRKATDQSVTGPARKFSLPKWIALAACLLIALSLGTNVMLVRSLRTQNELVTQEVFSGHLRALRTAHLIDVVSSDNHTVKPWFAGKLDFSPNVKDLAAEGFPLAGARVDYLDGRPVAALVFRHGQHVINLFTWPSTGTNRAETAQNGYTMLSWTKDGMTYRAVSDVNLVSLRRFATLYGY